MVIVPNVVDITVILSTVFLKFLTARLSSGLEIAVDRRIEKWALNVVQPFSFISVIYSIYGMFE